MTDLVLDTSAYSHFRRGHVGVTERLAEADLVYLPATVLGELRAGFELGDRLLENVATLDAFLDEPFVRPVAIDEKVAIRYGRLFAQLRRAGTPVPLNDLWIAATAQHLGSRIITLDADFSRIPDIDIELHVAP